VASPGSTGAARWEHFEHAADVGVRGYGATPAEAFEQAAVALVAAVTDPTSVAATTAVAIRCEAPDTELLLVDWLNALIYEMATRNMCFARFRVELDGPTLRGTAWGERADATHQDLAVEPKGATYTELRVARTADGAWLAQCVVDV
jgi:SHS2 domain-containing protein